MNEKNAKPLYTTISTDYLESLLSAKYILDNITGGTVKESVLRMVINSLMKAKRKHPHFADKMFSLDLVNAQSCLQSLRHDNDVQEHCGLSVAEEILKEEILEANEQYLLGNHEECSKELADVAAVIFRMIEMNESEANK